MALLIQMVNSSSKTRLEIENTELESLLVEFTKLFDEPTGLPPHRAHDHRIVLKDGTQPVSTRPYCYLYYQKYEIENIVEELLKTGMIQPSTSLFSSSVRLVKKIDGSWRMCVDYKALNQQTIKDNFLIPVIDELLDELYSATVFLKLYLRSRYHQIRVAPDDIAKTVFRMHEGHYEVLGMPLGLTNAPSTFQELINDIFKPYLR